MPDMILHYVEGHGYRPPQEFVGAVMNDRVVQSWRFQTKSIFPSVPEEREGERTIGYLSGPFETGPVPDGFVDRLEQLMIDAEPDFPVQYRIH